MYTDLQSENIICLFLCKSLLKIIYKHSFENQGCAAFKKKKMHPLIHTQTHTQAFQVMVHLHILCLSCVSANTLSCQLIFRALCSI